MPKASKIERKAYRPAEFAEATGLSRATVYRLMEKGVVRSVLVRRCRMIPLTELDRLLDAATVW